VQWDGQDWLSRWSRPFLGSVPHISSLGFDSSGLFAFGRFTDVMGMTATNIAHWDGTNWSDAGLPFGQDTELRAHAASPGHLYVGGNLTEAAGSPAASVARYDGATWSALGSGPSVSPRAQEESMPSAIFEPRAANPHTVSLSGMSCNKAVEPDAAAA